jgi:nitrilase
MVIDPWGTIVARRGRGAGVVTATIDLALQDRVRSALPTLRHARRGSR